MSRLSKRRNLELLSSIVKGRFGLEELCVEHRMNLEQLARWALQPSTARTLEGLRRLADIRTQMVISRYRAHAAARLIELTADGDMPETARKSCVDLLTTNVARDEEAEMSEVEFENALSVGELRELLVSEGSQTAEETDQGPGKEAV
ncbi:MAG TPA: hypothetical protein ENJ06_04775 [Phycisphaeraceae bacterium]|nr:hypothetical protein [Phycisphaeraceae bacterium]